MPVATRTRDLRDRVVADSDLRFAENVRLLPLNGRQQQPDTSRQPIEFVAILKTGDRNENSLPGSSSRSKVSAGKAELHVDRGRNPDLVIRQYDKLIALERAGEPVFEVLGIQPRGNTRFIAHLGDA